MKTQAAVMLSLLLTASCAGSQRTPGGAASGGGFGASRGAATGLAAGQSVTGDLACGQHAFVGPFHFTREGERLTLRTLVQASNAPTQGCVGGSIVDGSGAFVATTGAGCTEGAAAPGTIEYTFEPGAGGNGANPVYLDLSLARCSRTRASVPCEVGSYQVASPSSSGRYRSGTKPLRPRAGRGSPRRSPTPSSPPSARCAAASAPAASRAAAPPPAPRAGRCRRPSTSARRQVGHRVRQRDQPLGHPEALEGPVGGDGDLQRGSPRGRCPPRRR
jgi:hypothetical protein